MTRGAVERAGGAGRRGPRVVLGEVQATTTVERSKKGGDLPRRDAAQ